MKNTVVSGFSDPAGLFFATVVSAPGRKTRIQVIPVDDSVTQLQSELEFESDEDIVCVRWIPLPTKAVLQNGNGSSKNNNNNNNNSSPSKKSSKRKHSSDNTTNNGSIEDNKSFSYLAILLSSGEILLYSPLNKEVINKISTESTSVKSICKSADITSSTIWGIDSEELILKKLNCFDNRLQDNQTIPIIDKSIEFLTSIISEEESKLCFASSNLYIVSENFKDLNNKEEDIITIKPPKNHQNIITGLIQSNREKDLIAVIRKDDQFINIMSIAESSVIGQLKAKNTISSINLININDTECISCITENGDIEIFTKIFEKVNRSKRPTLSSIIFSTDAEHTGFINIFQKSTNNNNNNNNNNNSDYKNNNTNDNEQKSNNNLLGVWFDDFNVNFTDLEIEKNKKGSVVIATDSKEDGQDLVENEFYISESEDEGESDDDELEKEEPTEVYNLLKEYLSIENKENKENNKRLYNIVNQNSDKAKQVIYYLSNNESIELFKNLSFLIAESPQNNSSGVGEWVKYILLSRGQIISTDEDCIGILKLLQSSLVENIKLLPNLLSLQGRLVLLQSQLQLRNNLMNGKTGDDDEDEDEDDNTGEPSLLLDGENDDGDELEFEDAKGEGEDDDDEDEDDDDEDDEDDNEEDEPNNRFIDDEAEDDEDGDEDGDSENEDEDGDYEMA
ncbi:hypothetical protein B5S29_g2255 [[Candida] boidinii]|nr:hypothetical protein B5S29_g2255 [[Candida] boidinii]